MKLRRFRLCGSLTTYLGCSCISPRICNHPVGAPAEARSIRRRTSGIIWPNFGIDSLRTPPSRPMPLSRSSLPLHRSLPVGQDQRNASRPRGGGDYNPERARKSKGRKHRSTDFCNTIISNFPVLGRLERWIPGFFGAPPRKLIKRSTFPRRILSTKEGGGCVDDLKKTHI